MHPSYLLDQIKGIPEEPLPGSLYRVETSHPDEVERWSAISRHADAIRTKDELPASVYKLFSEEKLEEVDLYVCRPFLMR